MTNMLWDPSRRCRRQALLGVQTGAQVSMYSSSSSSSSSDSLSRDDSWLDVSCTSSAGWPSASFLAVAAD